MASAKTVWGIDIGQCALKAMKLRAVDEQLYLEAFDVVEHPKVLSQPDADRDQLMRNALEQFLARNNVAGCRVVVAAPGQSGFTRFVKLPPVEPRQVPEIVRFEAEQQIPFAIGEVIWRWQAFKDANSPDIEVGLFAMKRTDVFEVLDRFNEVGISADVVQMTPLALYNFMSFDNQCASDGATLLADVGADKTDLVVSDGARIWTRTLQLGGNNFTQALVKAFKLSFAKAEKLKRTAVTSPHARHIFQVMRPVFAELVQEIQRSIGYYTSLHRESRFKRVVGLGNGFRLPGLQKFLEQNLGIPVVRVDAYNQLSPSAAVNAPAFTENVLSFAVAYGLALQGLDLTRIQTSLLPEEIARRRRWARKRPWFAASAAMVLVALGGITWRAYADRRVLDPSGNETLEKVGEHIADCQALRAERNRHQGLDKAEEDKILKRRQVLAYRNFWPEAHFIVSRAIGQVAADQPLANEAGLKRLLAKPRHLRLMMDVSALNAQYHENAAGMTDQELDGICSRLGMSGPTSLTGYRAPARVGSVRGLAGFQGVGGAGAAAAGAGAAAPTIGEGRGFVLVMLGTTTQRGYEANRFLTSVKKAVEDISKNSPTLQFIRGQTGIVSDPGALTRGGYTPPMVGGTTQVPLDPLTGEDISGDTKFFLRWVVVVKGDGLPPLVAKAGSAPEGGAP